jgi:site-specific recombinase XerD
MKRVKLKARGVTRHNFRHAVGCHLLKAGCDIRFIQELLGHKELERPEIYTRINKEESRMF